MGLMYKFVYNLRPKPTMLVVSNMGMDTLDDSKVNLRVGSHEFRCLIKSCRALKPWDHNMKLSSMKRDQIKGLRW